MAVPGRTSRRRRFSPNEERADAFADPVDQTQRNPDDNRTDRSRPLAQTAKTAVQAAKEAGEPQAKIDELQITATGLTEQRNTLFKGETLRGLLLSAYAWSTVGRIAGIAAIGAFIAAVVVLVLVVLGIVHHRSTPAV